MGKSSGFFTRTKVSSHSQYENRSSVNVVKEMGFCSRFSNCFIQLFRYIVFRSSMWRSWSYWDSGLSRKREINIWAMLRSYHRVYISIFQYFAFIRNSATAIDIAIVDHVIVPGNAVIEAAPHSISTIQCWASNIVGSYPTSPRTVYHSRSACSLQTNKINDWQKIDDINNDTRCLLFRFDFKIMNAPITIINNEIVKIILWNIAEIFFQKELIDDDPHIEESYLSITTVLILNKKYNLSECCFSFSLTNSALAIREKMFRWPRDGLIAATATVQRETL